MSKWVVRWIDATIPAAILADDHSRIRARLVQALFLLATFGMVVAGIARYADVGRVYVSHWVGFLVFAGGATLLRFTGSLNAASIAVIATGHAALTANAVELGGWVAVLSWDAVLLAGAVYILGAKAGWVLGAVSLLTAFPIAIASDRGWLTPVPDLPQVEIAIMVTNQMVMMMLFTGLYARENRMLHANLEIAVERAQESNRAKSAFLATMSHEIRTPMNGVIASADLLRQSNLPEEDRVLADIVYNSGEVLLALLNDILDFSKFEAGELQLESIPFSLSECVTGVVELQSVSASDKGLALDHTIDPSLPAKVLGDGRRLRQVILNLVSNAVKFTADGRVHVAVSPHEDGIRFAVEDTGIGMTDEQRTRLFEPFIQADASVHRIHGGTGLGLAISQHIVQAMGGRIEVHSAQGHGSVFSFVLDLKPAQRVEHRAASDVASIDLHPLDGAVLVVDDNTTNRRVAEKLLERMGCTFVSAGNGEEALRALESTKFALILMDRQMPVLDGIETTRCIRAMESEIASVPIVGITASAFAEEIATCMEAGMQDVLAKPITLKALERAVAQWARRRA